MKANKNRIVCSLKTARGQLDGLLKMVEEDRYCVDISNQLLATQAILRNINKQIITAHLQHCVTEAFQNNEGDEKIEEIIALIGKISN